MSEISAKDVLLFLRASATNLLAALPLYAKLNHRSGRGIANESPDEAAAYFQRCVREYFEHLGVAPEDASSYLNGKRVLEYGPGDTLGVALLLYAHGAAYVQCVDRFPVHRLSDHSVRICRSLLGSLEGEAKERAERAFVVRGDPASGFDPNAIGYRVTADGTSGDHAAYDLVVSRAVLALVNRLDVTIQDIANALRPGGVSVHKVDLSSHGLDRHRPLDFLAWPDAAYRMMYSRKGRPNRWRVDTYQELVRNTSLRITKLTPTRQLSPAEVEHLPPSLARPFRDVPPDVLGWLGFWMLLEHP
ncbi:MAG: Methyltransferase type 12 [Labilithrix sp.]|nr:Methyltransferase type 12 [Labilithrix sp.]